MTDLDLLLSKLCELDTIVNNFDYYKQNNKDNNQEISDIIIQPQHILEIKIYNKINFTKYIFCENFNMYKKLIVLYKKNAISNYNFNSFIPNSVIKLMLCFNKCTINNLPNKIYHLGFINNRQNIIFKKPNKNIKYLELKDSADNIRGYKIIKINNRIVKLLSNVRENCCKKKLNENLSFHPFFCESCELYGKNGVEPICYNIEINKNYNINYDKTIVL